MTAYTLSPVQARGAAIRSAFRVGQRVRITAGGYSDERGTVRDVRVSAFGYRVILVYLDTLTLFHDDGHRLEVVSQ